MFFRWIAAIACASLAVTAQAASRATSTSQVESKTIIDGRTFNFPIPDVNDSDFYQSIHEEFLIGALNTPSPPKQIWKPFSMLMDIHRARDYVVNYLESLPAPTNAELKKFLVKIKSSMIFVEGGAFDMGDYGWLTPAKAPMTYSSAKDMPHKVTLDSYSLMKNMVTYAEYDMYSRTSNKPLIGIDSTSLDTRYPNYPAFVNWKEARNYCLWLGKLTKQPFDLDTSAQYEYAARSGGKWLLLASTYQKLDELVPDLNKFYDLMDAKTDNISPDKYVVVPVGTYGPNHLGFEDMVGTMEEWVYDWYGPYTDAPLTNPRGPKEGIEKVVRTPNYDGRGTINRWKANPNEPFGVFRCAINSIHAWK